MGLFTKKPTQTSSTSPLYTIGSQKTLLLVGLGNPGKEYDQTRHNVGFMCLDAFIESTSDFTNWVVKKDMHCQITNAQLGSTRVIAIKPTTYMNESGRAVAAVQQFYKIPASSTIVIHDELDIPFGQIKTKIDGGSAGHNGLKSIIAATGENFERIRIGINNEYRTKADEKDFVLKPFAKQETERLDQLHKEVVNILNERIFSDKLTVETRSFII